MSTDEPLSDSEKLRVLAVWFDRFDKDPSAAAEILDTSGHSHEVQDDLRRIAQQLEEVEFMQWLARAKTDLAPKMDGSKVVLTMSPGSDPDPKIALETGYAVLLNKPLVAITWPGHECPPGLARYARAVIDISQPLSSDEGQAELQRKLKGALEGVLLD